MGLAGRKQKQRIPNDPRNLSWADDAARFGQSYMSKLGWDPSKGLGASGEGMKSHLKVSQKLDMLGIGAAHQQDPHGIAWKQNKEFEALLKRLNAQDTQESTSTLALGEFVRPEQHTLDTHTDGEKVEQDGVSNQPRKEKKRRRKDGEDCGDRKEKKKRKKEKRQDEELEGSAADSLIHTPLHIDSPSSSSSPDTISSTPQTKPKGRPMAHRARIQAAKRLANKSAAAISEILGIAPTPLPISSMTHSGSLTPITPADSDLTLEKLTTSNKSVGDYFKEKLGAKSGSNTPATNVDVDASRRGTDSSTPSHNDDDQLRMGLGASRKSQVEEDSDRPRAGIGGLSNAFTQFFAASSSSHATVVQMASSATHAIVQSPMTMATSYKVGEEETTDKQRRKAKKKEERRESVEEVDAPLGTGDETLENGAKAERKKLKEEKRKMRSADFTEEHEGGSESNSKRRKEDKKKKKVKCDIQTTAQGPSIHEDFKLDSKDEKRPKKFKKRTETVKEDK